MNCECGEVLRWSSDWDYEDYGISENDGIVTIYSCDNDDCYVDQVEVFKDLKKDK